MEILMRDLEGRRRKASIIGYFIYVAGDLWFLLLAGDSGWAYNCSPFLWIFQLPNGSLYGSGMDPTHLKCGSDIETDDTTLIPRGRSHNEVFRESKAGSEAGWTMAWEKAGQRDWLGWLEGGAMVMIPTQAGAYMGWTSWQQRKEHPGFLISLLRYGTEERRRTRACKLSANNKNEVNLFITSVLILALNVWPMTRDVGFCRACTKIRSS